MLKNILNFSIGYFQPPKAVDTIADQIADHERKLLEHQANSHYHAKLAEYYAEGITRLQKFKPAQLKSA